MSDFLTHPTFLTAGMWLVFALGVLVLIFGVRDTLRRRPTTSEAGRYMIAHRVDELTPGGIE